jgi:hypothetical protein
LRRLLERSSLELEEMGGIGRTLIREQYTWDIVAAQTLQLYRWVCGDAIQPEFVDAMEQT